MSSSHYILNPRTREYFDLGSLDFNGPLEEFGHWDYDPLIHNTSTLFHTFTRYTLNREDIAQSREGFIDVYTSWFGDEQDLTYIREVGGMIWDWMGEDNCWIYGEGYFDYFLRDGWTQTGTRYNAS